MKIIHVCLANFYIDFYGYQENVITKMHHLQGHDVKIIASTENYSSEGGKFFGEPKRYKNENSIEVVRLPYVNFIPELLARKIRVYSNVVCEIEDFEPDVIFVHGCQFFDIWKIAEYAKNNPEVSVFVDNHSDFNNSAKGFLSGKLLHGILYRWCAKRIEPFVKEFYGTLPNRASFLVEKYGVNKDKVSVLPTGFDDTLINLDNRADVRQNARLELGIDKDDLVLITGGKIDGRKNISSLLDCFDGSFPDRIKLVLFGTATESTKHILDKAKKKKNVILVGWLNQVDIQRYLVASDLAVFPGSHSVVWEQSVGLGLPGIFRHWKEMDHVDLGGNCIFIDEGDSVSIKNSINYVINNQERLDLMKDIARRKGPEKFAYSMIAKRAIHELS